MDGMGFLDSGHWSDGGSLEMLGYANALDRTFDEMSKAKLRCLKGWLKNRGILWYFDVFVDLVLVTTLLKLLWTETSWALWIKSQLRSSQDVLIHKPLETLRKKTSCGPSYTCWVLSMPSKQSVVVTWESSSLYVPSLSFSSASRTSLLRS